MNAAASPGSGFPEGAASREGAAPLEADRAARRLAQTEFVRPLLLEAGAGTGKTTTLVARVLAWCLGPGWERHWRRAEKRQRETGRTEPPGADEVAAEVLERVVAITFTEDAAAEMAHRVARQLGELAQAAPEAPLPGWLHLPDVPAAERGRRAAALLATLDRLVVRTIHAFCRGLLADHPLEARLHPDLVVDADGLLLEEVARETVETRLRSFYGAAATDEGPYLPLATRGIGPRELVEALVVLSQAGVPADGLDENPLSPARVAALRRRLGEACAALGDLAGPLCAGMPAGRNARKLAEAAAGTPERLAEGDLAALVEALRETFPANLVTLLGKWGKADAALNKAESEAFSAVREELAAHATRLRTLLRNLDALDPELLRLAHAALAPLHREVRRELRSRGIATFEDLLAEAARLLAGRPDVAAGARSRIEQLLVDEFQDTDALQCEIVARLGLEGPEANRPGLFLVGDPKQSIYGWRSADLASYDAFRRRVADAGGAILPLVRNFRSVPAILDEVERVVAPVMTAERGLQPPYQVLRADEGRAGAPGFTSGGDPVGDSETGSGSGTARGTGRTGVLRQPVEHWVSWRRSEAGGSRSGAGAGTADAERCGPETPKTASYELEADAIARDLRDLHDRHGLPWQEAALLLRSTSDLDVYLEALRRHGVPFAVGRDKQYYRRREVIDAAALVRCVLDPGDHLALLTVMRSPWVGVPDAALVPLWNRGFPDLATGLAGGGRGTAAALGELRAVAEAAAADLAGLGPGEVPGLERVRGWELSLVAALEQLAAARRAFRELPADAFVDTLRHLFLPEPVAAARYLGAYRLANLERFFRRLVSALEDGGGDVTAVLRALRRSVTEAQEAPEGKPQEGADQAVQVLTMHQAKGLDFGHVYLPQLHKEPGGTSPATVVERAPGGAADDGALGPGEEGPRKEGPGTAGGGFEMKLFGAPTLGFDRVEARRRRVEAAERVRLLYVAMTRPKHRLVMLGCWPGTDAGAPPEPDRARHFLDLLAHRRPEPAPPLAARWEEAAREAGPGTAPGSTRGTAPAAAAGRSAAAGDDVGALWRFPALEAWPESAPAATAAAPEVDAPRVAAAGRALERRQQAARTRMERPFAAPASEEAHHLLRQALGGPDGSAAGGAGTAHPELASTDPARAPVRGFAGAASPDAEGGAAEPRSGAGSAPGAAGAGAVGAERLSRAAAMALGTALHRLLEEVDPASPAAGLDALRDRLPVLLAPELAEDERPAARAEAEAVLDRLLDGGQLLARLQSLAPHLLGREVPLLLAPPARRPAEIAAAAAAPGTGPPPPVAFLSGAIDLLYRDPETDEVVVADYKTDWVDDEAGLEARARVYVPQGRVYAQAVQEALGLDHPPRFELWFLRADRVHRVDLGREVPPRDPGPPAAPTQIALFDLE